MPPATKRLSDVFWHLHIAPQPEKAHSNASLNHQLFELRNGLCRVQALRTRFRAVQYGVAAVETERVFKVVEPFSGRFVTGSDDPAIGLKQCGGP